MIWRATYITDAGKIYPFISLQVAESFLPAVFKENALQGAGFCALPRTIQPRKVIVWDTEGEQHTIQYPFQPSSSLWLQFWQEIKSNPLIVSKGIGEITGVK